MASRLNSIARLIGIQVVKSSRLNRLIEDASLQNRISIALIQQSKGVLHIGAHFGEEAHQYNSLGKPVLWVEGVPEYFEILVENIKDFPNQKALNYFLSDCHQDVVPFYLTNNEGSSSSLFKLNELNPFKGLAIAGVLDVETFSLTEIVASVEIVNYDHWIIDVQGAELEVLKGATEYLKYAKTLVVECSTYDLYSSQARFQEIADFLKGNGFEHLWSMPENSHGDVIFVHVG